MIRVLQNTQNFRNSVRSNRFYQPPRRAPAQMARGAYPGAPYFASSRRLPGSKSDHPQRVSDIHTKAPRPDMVFKWLVERYRYALCGYAARKIYDHALLAGCAILFIRQLIRYEQFGRVGINFEGGSTERTASAGSAQVRRCLVALASARTRAHAMSS